MQGLSMDILYYFWPDQYENFHINELDGKTKMNF